ncbi:hypothetical protein CRUP_030049, partial [Coryphaenoides rupestris]
MEMRAPTQPMKPKENMTMPVKKKRKLPVAEDHRMRKSKITRTPLHAAEHVTVSEKTFSSKKCMAWFQEYAGPDHVLGPDGMEKFCEDIGGGTGE